MTPTADLELSRQLSALRVPPPDNSFEARLRSALRTETLPARVRAAPRTPARVLRFSARRRPLVLVAAGTLAFAGAAAAALDGRVWRAIVAVTAPSTPTAPAADDATERAQHTRHARSVQSPSSSTPEPAATPAAAAQAALAEAASHASLPTPTLPATAKPVLAQPAPALGEPRSRHEGTVRPARPEAASSRRDRPELPARSVPDSTVGHGVPRLDLGDLPRGGAHPDTPRNDPAPVDRLRDLARPTEPAENARQRAADARERAADRSRGADHQRRPLDAPALDVERERRGSQARDQEESNREGRTERGRAEREGH